MAGPATTEGPPARPARVSRPCGKRPSAFPTLVRPQAPPDGPALARRRAGTAHRAARSRLQSRFSRAASCAVVSCGGACLWGAAAFSITHQAAHSATARGVERASSSLPSAGFLFLHSAAGPADHSVTARGVDCVALRQPSTCSPLSLHTPGCRPVGPATASPPSRRYAGHSTKNLFIHDGPRPFAASGYLSHSDRHLLRPHHVTKRCQRDSPLPAAPQPPACRGRDVHANGWGAVCDPGIQRLGRLGFGVLSAGLGHWPSESHGQSPLHVSKLVRVTQAADGWLGTASAPSR